LSLCIIQDLCTWLVTSALLTYKRRVPRFAIIYRPRPLHQRGQVQPSLQHGTPAMTTNKGQFKAGHAYHPRRRTDIPLTIRQRRKRDAQLIDAMLTKIATDQAAGLPTNPTDVTRLIGVRERLEREGI
jgi:hypothetical protein